MWRRESLKTTVDAGGPRSTSTRRGRTCNFDSAGTASIDQHRHQPSDQQRIGDETKLLPGALNDRVMTRAPKLQDVVCKVSLIHEGHDQEQNAVQQQLDWWVGTSLEFDNGAEPAGRRDRHSRRVLVGDKLADGAHASWLLGSFGHLRSLADEARRLVNIIWDRKYFMDIASQFLKVWITLQKSKDILEHEIICPMTCVSHIPPCGPVRKQRVCTV